ncbi:hypothetical protein P3X46_022198 [Hevea brasiliensis]|uniref:Uncharacterized protein n=1 Tax=Hevea brasiliensis TaxID=3981 RepID=A0ABQ9L8N5_HEVBR|nr:hypothetical protein P3X46_022198 [Hevea brasiliensis]
MLVWGIFLCRHWPIFVPLHSILLETSLVGSACEWLGGGGSSCASGLSFAIGLPNGLQGKDFSLFSDLFSTTGLGSQLGPILVTHVVVLFGLMKCCIGLKSDF